MKNTLFEHVGGNQFRIKDILLESPTNFSYENKQYNSSTDGLYTFMVYPDIIDQKSYWIAWDYRQKAIMCENSMVVDEIIGSRDSNSETIAGIELRNKPEDYVYTTNSFGTDMKYLLRSIGNKQSHGNLLTILVKLRRANSADVNDLLCMGRLFGIDNNRYVFSFWDNNRVVINYKSKIDSFLNNAGIKIDDNLMFERRKGSDKIPAVFVTYNEFFR